IWAHGLSSAIATRGTENPCRCRAAGVLVSRPASSLPRPGSAETPSFERAVAGVKVLPPHSPSCQTTPLTQVDTDRRKLTRTVTKRHTLTHEDNQPPEPLPGRSGAYRGCPGLA